MARSVTVVVETGKDLYSCFMASKGTEDLSFSLIGDGKTAREAVNDFLVCRDEMRELYKEEGLDFPEIDFNFVFDVGAFFNFYPISVTAFAKYIGMNASLMRQYAAGIKEPRGKSLKRIRDGIEKVKRDIDGGLLIDKPVLQYV